MEHDINEREEKHRVLNRVAREIHEIAQAIGGKIYEQDTALDFIVKKNSDSANYVHYGQEELGIARVDYRDSEKTSSQKEEILLSCMHSHHVPVSS